MMLYSSEISSEGDKQRTFKMLPMNRHCPFVQAIFYPQDKTLLILSSNKNTHILSKRETIELRQEYILSEKTDMDYFIETFARNSESFDYKSFTE